jgi:hypothetical protein
MKINDFAPLMQEDSRKHIHEIWQMLKDKKPKELRDLDEENQLLAKILYEHKDEMHNDFEFSDVLHEKEYDDEEGNPFMHIFVHQVIENQLAAKEPIEVTQFYFAVLKNKESRHDTIHLIGAIFVQFLFPVLKGESEFDNDGYQRMLKQFKGKKLEKVYEALDRL